MGQGLGHADESPLERLRPAAASDIDRHSGGVVMWIIKLWKRWCCRRQFNRLSSQWQRIFKTVNLDPDGQDAQMSRAHGCAGATDSKIARGEL
jgi:hypothetical protein